MSLYAVEAVGVCVDAFYVFEVFDVFGVFFPEFSMFVCFDVMVSDDAVL